MKLAFPHVTETIFFLDAPQLIAGEKYSQTSPRRRVILPIHRQLQDGVQRLVNFLQPGTYVAPHHHPAEGFSETILVLTGKLAFLAFDEQGNVLQQRVLTGGTPECLVDFVGPVIHSFVCLEADTAVLEIKQGPYAGSSDKIFVTWAPREGEPGASDYMSKLEKLVKKFG